MTDPCSGPGVNNGWLGMRRVIRDQFDNNTLMCRRLRGSQAFISGGNGGGIKYAWFTQPSAIVLFPDVNLISNEPKRFKRWNASCCVRFALQKVKPQWFCILDAIGMRMARVCVGYFSSRCVFLTLQPECRAERSTTFKVGWAFSSTDMSCH